MKIYGPYKRKDGRKHVVIVHEDGSRQTRSYPRLLLEQKLGRTLLPDETVDHINGDFTDDRLENLQALTLQENARKAVQHAERVALQCKHCGCHFSRRKAIEDYNRITLNKDGPFCSHRCAGKVYH